MTATFAERLAAVVAASGPLCVGIDPHASLLAGWGLPDSADGVREFGLRILDAVAGRAGIVKPQVAFFERHGAAGYRALEDVLAAARAAGVLVIADVKRGDLGTSVDAYGEAWLGAGSTLEADAMTAVAYQGLGSLDGVIARADAAGKGVFVLAATSNPEAVATQQAVRADGLSVAAGLVADIRARESGALGVVVGATIVPADYGLDAAALGALPILAPGFGAQGALIGDVPALFGSAAPRVLVAVSRSILEAGRDGLEAAIDRANREVSTWRT
jgi:orotidine-5'-phosphate decarboxylase